MVKHVYADVGVKESVNIAASFTVNTWGHDVYYRSHAFAPCNLSLNSIDLLTCFAVFFKARFSLFLTDYVM